MSKEPKGDQLVLDATDVPIRAPERHIIPAQPAPTSMLEVIDRAIHTPGFSVDMLERLLSFKREIEKDERKRAFGLAMTAFKAETIVLIKDKLNKQYESKYITLENLVATVTPFLSKHGLSADWELDQIAGIKVTCVVSHEGYEGKRVPMIVPPDDSGKKNAIQQIKSAITYAKTCTYESALGLAASNSNLSDDGNSTSNGELSERIEWIQNARNLEELQTLYKDAYKLFSDNPGAQRAIIQAKDMKKKELMQ